MNDILNTLKNVKLKKLRSFNMKFHKTYKCPQCGHSFTKALPTNFIKSVMPECPSCGGRDIKVNDKIEKKKDK